MSTSPSPESMVRAALDKTPALDPKDIEFGRMCTPNFVVAEYRRGVTTLYGYAEPLYIIDGMAVTVQPGEGLNWLDPADILQIDVLKDVASTTRSRDCATPGWRVRAPSATSTPMARRRAIKRNMYKTSGPTSANPSSQAGQANAPVSPNCRPMQERVEDCHDCPPR